MVDERLELALNELLERYSIEEVLNCLLSYVETQAQLFSLFQQSDAEHDLQMQVNALKMAYAVMQ